MKSFASSCAHVINWDICWHFEFTQVQFCFIFLFGWFFYVCVLYLFFLFILYLFIYFCWFCFVFKVGSIFLDWCRPNLSHAREFYSNSKITKNKSPVLRSARTQYTFPKVKNLKKKYFCIDRTIYFYCNLKIILCLCWFITKSGAGVDWPPGIPGTVAVGRCPMWASVWKWLWIFVLYFEFLYWKPPFSFYYACIAVRFPCLHNSVLHSLWSRNTNYKYTHNTNGLKIFWWDLIYRMCDFTWQNKCVDY